MYVYMHIDNRISIVVWKNKYTSNQDIICDKKLRRDNDANLI